MQARGRWVVALLALTAIAALSSSLGNVYLDVSRKLTREFRAYGANIIVSAPAVAGGQNLLDESTLKTIPEDGIRIIARAPFLYVVGRASPRHASGSGRIGAPAETKNVMVAGTWLDRASDLFPWWKIAGSKVDSRDDLSQCLVGVSVARQWNLVPGQTIELREGERTARLMVAGIITSGGSEDSEVFVNLPVAQHLANLPGKISLIQVSASGTPRQVGESLGDLQRGLPNAEVKPVRQVAVAEGQLLHRIRWMLAATTLAILLVVTLCVAATMLGLAFERRYDIGVMKALGAGQGTVVRLFVLEATAMALAGGLVGYGLGLVLAAWIGHEVFRTSFAVRWIVFPFVLAVSLLVALVGTIFPVRILQRMQPATILRGE